MFMNLDFIKDTIARDNCSPELKEIFQEAIQNLSDGDNAAVKGLGARIAAIPEASMILKHLALSLEQLAAGNN